MTYVTFLVSKKDLQRDVMMMIMMMMLITSSSSLPFLPPTDHGKLVKEKIVGVVMDLLIKLIEAEGESTDLQTAGQAGLSMARQGQEESSYSRGSTRKGSRYARCGIAVASAARRKTAAEKANDVWTAYLVYCQNPAGIGAYVNGEALPWHQLLRWWKDVGMKADGGKFASLGKVFRLLLTVPGAAAGLERDFSVAGSIVTPKRSSLDGAWVEMILFLYLNRDLVPYFQQIQILDANNTDKYLPRRLRDKKDFARFREMDVETTGFTRAQLEEEAEEEEVEEAGGRDDDSDSDYTGGEDY